MTQPKEVEETAVRRAYEELANNLKLFIPGDRPADALYRTNLHNDLKDRALGGMYCPGCRLIFRKSKEELEYSRNTATDETFTVTCLKCKTVLSCDEWSN